jgi:hypothetical protein
MRDLSKYYLEIEESRGKATAEATEYLYSLYTDGIYKWLASIWDREIGGFYFSCSARDNEFVTVKDRQIKLLPDIESTEQAFGALLSDGIGKSFEDYPLAMRDKAIKFIASCQDPEDGYFYHKQWGKNIGTSRRARDMNKGVSIMKDLGGRPLYPTAIERIAEIYKEGNTEGESSTVPEHLRSKAAFVDYLESLEINKDSYSVGHRIGAQVPEIKAAGLADVCYEFLNSTQFSNGLWQDQLSYRASNGLMKISCAYRSLGKPLPNMMKSFKAAVDIACNDELAQSDGITCVYNPPFTMLNLFKTMEDVGDKENYELSKKMIIERSPEILIKTADKVKIYKEPDGSFSYCVGHPSYTSQGMHVCIPGLPESDVNSNALARGSRTMTLKALDIPVSPLFDEKDTKLFFELCGEA